MTNAEIIELWLDALAAERGTAASSLTTYRRDVACYLGWLGERRLAEVTRQDMVAYLAHLDQRALSHSTISRRRSVANGIHRFMVAEGLGTGNPAAELQPMKRPDRLPFTPGIEAVDRLIETAHALARDGSVGLYRQAGYARRAALLETLYASGMRVSEAVTRPADAVRPGTRMIHVRGKGGKDRLVPLHDRAVEAIGWWRELAGRYGSRSDVWLFHRVSNGEQHLTIDAALKEIKETAAAAGIPNASRWSPHKLRHAFATHLLQNGADLRVIGELLGHADLGTTEVYTKVNLARAQKMVRDLHPLSDASS
ncbi:tyrosine-type recombinase/integrase [Methylobacterium sp. EM32]|uniref:tyrosine-type recombinase/integrase n=1 Tax=Methylobacterium sp. EM32 TaxID=3163481 RepID=UPI0033A676D3